MPKIGGAASPTAMFWSGCSGEASSCRARPRCTRPRASARGITYIYRLLDADHMGDGYRNSRSIVAYAEQFGFNGLNVTFPYKQEIIPLLDELSEAARGAGLGQHGRPARRPPRRPQHRHVGIPGEFPRRNGRTPAATASCFSVPAGPARRWRTPARERRRATADCAISPKARPRPLIARGLRSRFGARSVKVGDRPRVGCRARRRHRQCDAGRHGETARQADRSGAAAAASAGLPTSFISRWRRNCLRMRGGVAAAP